MLHIILLILKFIGIVLLALLGLLVTLLLVVLLIPVRYRILASHGAMLRLDGRVSWFLHLIHLRVTQEGEKRRIRLRLFGIVLYDSDRPRKPRKPKHKRKKTADRSKARSSRERTKGQKTIELQPEGVRTPGNSPMRGEVASEDDGLQSKQLSSEEQDLTLRKDPDAMPDMGPTAADRMDSSNASFGADSTGTPWEEPKDSTTSGEETEEAVGALGRILRRIKSILQGIRDKLHRLFIGMKKGLSKLTDIKQKIDLIKEFIGEEENRKAFGVTWQSLKKLLRHVLPKKLRSRVVFGTGDPCSTGQALGAASILYGIYGEHVRITPDFENKVFEGSHYARGRIRMGTLLIIVIKLLLDKRFKQLKRNIKILKEAL